MEDQRKRDQELLRVVKNSKNSKTDHLSPRIIDLQLEDSSKMSTMVGTATMNDLKNAIDLIKNF